MPSLSDPQFAAEFSDLTGLMVEEVAGCLPPEQRARLAQRLAQRFLDLWGGCYVYVPLRSGACSAPPDLRAARGRRDAMIRAEHDDSDPLSVHRLARRYGLSEIAVYRILSQRALVDPTCVDAPGSPA